eukprot:TRINITY_DN17100_c0_g2_i2.p4 TRINITY_DN17100_c0_g2~~TRINITY_DN17100_c0_g2_i2.p4  ORF type:complete len:114 (+),score=0.86 TRINITY_DN17100_c0_g2_i2:464-805(+)
MSVQCIISNISSTFYYFADYRRYLQNEIIRLVIWLEGIVCNNSNNKMYLECVKRQFNLFQSFIIKKVSCCTVGQILIKFGYNEVDGVRMYTLFQAKLILGKVTFSKNSFLCQE